jgi:hypothetical protein
MPELRCWRKSLWNNGLAKGTPWREPGSVCQSGSAHCHSGIEAEMLESLRAGLSLPWDHEPYCRLRVRVGRDGQVGQVGRVGEGRFMERHESNREYARARFGPASTAEPCGGIATLRLQIRKVAVHRAGRDAENAGGLQLVAAALLNRGSDELPGGLVHGGADGNGDSRTIAGCRQ